MTLKERPFLLLTNDDGIHAAGLKVLWQAVHSFADIAIVAPRSEKSGSGLSITWVKPLMIESVPWELTTSAWSVSGTPADCVKMALSSLLKKRPHMVLSGVNKGSNAGRTVLYSGTVGGTIEASFQGIPAIAFSFCDLTIPPAASVIPFIAPLVQHLLHHPLPQGTLLNVNFPLNAATSIKGLKLATQGRSYWVEDPVQRTHPEGIPYCWLGGKWKSFEETSDSDVALLDQGYATAVPIRPDDLTDRNTFHSHKQTIEHLFVGAETQGLSTK